jgi:hypothetical protein
MLRYNPHERIDPVRIVHHPWITSNCAERPDLVELMTKCRPPAAKGQVQVRTARVLCNPSNPSDWKQMRVARRTLISTMGFCTA